MKIKSLILKNFGKHSDFKLENINGPIIGITGPNGNGKSTIVSALKFLFTGDPGNGKIESWIKRGQDNPLYVECVFEKDGIIGKIFRKVTQKGSSSRSFIWGNNPPIVKDKEFNEALEEVLGIDKQSLLNTIFISQGEIANLLSTTDSKRVELFSKLLNLNFISKRAYVVDEKLKQLKSSVVNIGPIKDNIVIKQKEFDEESSNLHQKLLKIQEKYGTLDFVKELNFQCKSYIEESEHLSQLIQNNKTKIFYENLKISFEEILSKYKNLNTYDEVLKYINDKIDDISKVIISKSYNIEINKLRKQLYTELKNLRSKQRLLNNLNLIFEGKNPNEIRSLIENYNTYLNNKKLYNDNVIQRDELKNKLSLIKDIENDDVISNLNSEISDIDNKLFNLSNLVHQLNILKDAKLKLKNIIHKDTAVCPICGLKLMLGQEICDGDINAINEQINLIDIQKNNLSQNKNDKIKRISSLNDEKQKTSIEKSILDEKLRIIEKSINSFTSNNYFDSPEIHSLISSYQKNIDEYSILYNENLYGKLNDIYNTIKNQFSIDINDNTTDEEIDKYINTTVEDLKEDEITNLKNEKQNYKTQLNNIISIKSSLDAAKQSMDNYNNLIEEASKKVNNHIFKNMIVKYSTDKSYQFDYNYINISDIIDKTDNALSEFKEIDINNKVLSEIKQYIDSESERVKNIEKENIKIYTNINELERIKQLLSPKEGITRKYLNYLFNNIVEYVSEYLGYLESNFIIALEDRSDKEDLSFKFKRIDISDDNWYEMNKLSGGQRIKLSIAFLIAIQKVICPNLCFLVLDEPSTHLDSESVDALTVMLQQIGTMLNNQHGQIWIIDHIPTIERAFNDNIKL